MSWTVIPANRQGPGELVGGFWVILQAWPIANLFTLALLGPEGARVTAGGGGWETIPVPRGVGITEWKGRPNYEMSLDLLYDGWLIHPQRPNPPRSFIGRPNLPIGITHASTGLWMEGTIATLESLAVPGRDMVTPPSLRIYGAVPHTDLRWVIQSLEWGDAVRDRITGRRMRQQVTVHLLEYNQPTDLAKLPRGKAK